jgi:hypothetical protein
MPASIQILNGKARLVIPSRGGIAAIGGSQVPSAFGEDGREVQLQKSATHIQWRYEGEAAWTNLVALSELEGEPGAQGETGPMPYDYRGAWDGFTSYGLYDAVTYQGSLYWLPATGGWTIGGAPPAYNWELLVSKGDTGEQGETGKSAYQSYLDTTADDPVLTEGEWSEGGGGGGDFLPLAGGTMDNGAEIAFDNASKIRQTPGSNGIDQVCSIDYVHRWKEGSLYILDQSNGIRSVQHGLSFTPDSTFNVTGGYLVGSRFTKDDGTTFECTNNTEGGAVWVDVTPLPIATPGIAYVNAGGNDAEGAIGNPGLPYLTAQAAWDDGARNLELGGGSYTVTHYSTSDGTGQETVRVRGIGKDSTSLTINWSGTPATEESPAGKMPVKPILLSDQSVSLTINLSGGDAHSGDNNGGAAPSFEFWHCFITSFSTVGGNGSGSGSSGGTSGGMTRWCEVQTGFGSGNAIDFFATLEGDAFKGGILASNVVYGGSTVDATLTTLLARATPEQYMRTTDFTDSSGTVSDVTGLSCSVAADEKILIEIVGFRVGGAAGSGLKISFSGPASPTDVRYTLEHWNAVNTGRTVAAATSFNSVLTQADGNTDSLPIRVTLTLINGPNADTVRFRAGSEGSGTSINLLKGLTMRVHRIP